MFDGIAPKYDLLNTVTSLGFDRRWRKKAVAALRLTTGDRLLDLAAGTLDISIAAANRYPGIQVIAADPSKGMLRMGKQKLSSSTLVSIMASTGEHLPLQPNSVHAAIIAFGIRNFADRHAALRQLSTVLVSGGRLVILELSTPKGSILAPMARFYVQRMIPLFGAILSSHSEYAYLPESMKRFPAPNTFATELTQAGFTVPHVERFMSGACHLYICEKQ